MIELVERSVYVIVFNIFKLYLNIFMRFFIIMFLIILVYK